MLRSAGWQAFVMHRVNRFVHGSLLIDGWIELWEG